MSRLNERQRQILTRLAAAPRNFEDLARAFSDTPRPTLRQYLDALDDEGLIDSPQHHSGAYTLTESGRDWLAVHAERTPPITYGNFSMKPGSYKPARMASPREEANRNCEILSRGTPA